MRSDVSRACKLDKAGIKVGLGGMVWGEMGVPEGDGGSGGERGGWADGLQGMGLERTAGHYAPAHAGTVMQLTAGTHFVSQLPACHGQHDSCTASPWPDAHSVRVYKELTDRISSVNTVQSQLHTPRNS